MNLQTYFPKPPLSHFIHQFWQVDDYQPPHPRERILPHGTMELVIDLTGEPMRIFAPSENRFASAIVIGAHSDYYVVDTSRRATVLAVWFKPGAAMSFFNVSGRELHNLHVPLDVLWGAAGCDLYERLLEAKTTLGRFHILEGVLLDRLTRAKARHRAVPFALTAFEQAQSVSHVIDQIGISSPRFIRVFSDEVGLTPKLFCRVRRFQAALQLIVRCPSHSWVDIALNCGYFDQSHFINDFQAFTGISPTAYTAQYPDHPNNLPFFD
jgi:AraC-like DNA-binding protein